MQLYIFLLAKLSIQNKYLIKKELYSNITYLKVKNMIQKRENKILNME